VKIQLNFFEGILRETFFVDNFLTPPRHGGGCYLRRARGGADRRVFEPVPPWPRRRSPYLLQFLLSSYSLILQSVISHLCQPAPPPPRAQLASSHIKTIMLQLLGFVLATQHNAFLCDLLGGGCGGGAAGNLFGLVMIFLWVRSLVMKLPTSRVGLS